MNKMMGNMDQEKQRQVSRLEDEIKRRREKKEKKQRKELEAEEAKAVKADDEEEERQVEKVNKEEAKYIQKKLEQSARPSTPQRSYPKVENVLPSHDSDSPVPVQHMSSRPMDVHLGSLDINHLIMSTPLFSHLSEIEKLLHTHFSSRETSSTSFDNRDTTPYIDIKDAQWECKGNLVPTDVQSLKPSDFVVYQFGVFSSKLLQKRNGLPQVTVLLASNLPPNNYSRNCFRNSFFYVHTKNILFVRKERLVSVGEFVLVILHCLAHIKAGDLTDDNNPLFLREFYKVCMCMYYVLHVASCL